MIVRDDRALAGMPNHLLALGKGVTKLGRRLPFTAQLLGLRRHRARTKLLRLMPKNSVCAEIGVWQGEFSERILQAVEPRRLFLIDPWSFEGDEEDQWHGGNQGHATSQAAMDAVYERVVDRFRKVPGVSIIRDVSSGAVAHFEDDFFDWIYIDGNHSFEYVRADLEAYLPKVKSSGYVTGDDYFWSPREGFPVKRAVEQVVDAGRARLLSVRSGQWILRKS